MWSILVIVTVAIVLIVFGYYNRLRVKSVNKTKLLKQIKDESFWSVCWLSIFIHPDPPSLTIHAIYFPYSLFAYSILHILWKYASILDSL